MSEIMSCNGELLCKPFVGGIDLSKSGVTNGVPDSVRSQRSEMIFTTVVYGDGKDYPAGTIVYFDPEMVGANWAKKIRQVGGNRVMSVPVTIIKACARP